MYITEEEIPIYCPIVKETNIGHVETACFLIDAYKGTSFELKEYTELVNFNKRSRFVDFLEPYRGKLKHLPRKEVKEVYTIVPTVFSKFTRIDYSVDSLCFDEDTSKYFSFYLPQDFVSPIRKLKTLINWDEGKIIHTSDGKIRAKGISSFWKTSSTPPNATAGVIQDKCHQSEM